MSEILTAEHGQRGGDAVQNAFQVNVDHLLPVVDPELVKKRNWRNADVVDEHVEVAEALAGQLYEV